MKTMFLLTNCWPCSTMNHDQASCGMVTDDEVVAQAWKERDEYNGYEEVKVVGSVQDMERVESENVSSVGGA